MKNFTKKPFEQPVLLVVSLFFQDNILDVQGPEQSSSNMAKLCFLNAACLVLSELTGWYVSQQRY